MTDSVNNRIAELREAKGWRRTVIAGHLNVGERTVMRWEADEISIPSKVIPELAALLETTPEHVMGWDREEAKA